MGNRSAKQVNSMDDLPSYIGAGQNQIKTYIRNENSTLKSRGILKKAIKDIKTFLQKYAVFSSFF
jgi:uncharacterized protein involved in exopolysaccharide biosynthesis